MKGMRYDIAVLDNVIDSRHSITVDYHLALLYRVFLKLVSLHSRQAIGAVLYVVSLRPITELCSKDVE